MADHDPSTPTSSPAHDATAEEAELDPRDMLSLLSQQQRSTRRTLDRALIVILAAWAASWLVGYLAMWSGEGLGGNPWFRIPDAAAGTVFGIAIAAGSVVSAVAGASMGRGVRGRSVVAGRYYGLSWPVAMMATGVFAGLLSSYDLSGELAAVLYPGMFTLIVATLYLAGAAVWRSGGQFALGAIMALLVVAATAVGSPSHYLIYGVAGPVLLVIFIVLLRTGAMRSEAPTEGEAKSERDDD